ncbi:MAG: polysaccharide biosynthesis/export family protein [Candidatus Omnitrophica bacterium]|nr:polysaccharide biosynthesis/export family protein [Candidatus Omnitrophota bacterium]
MKNMKTTRLFLIGIVFLAIFSVDINALVQAQDVPGSSAVVRNPLPSLPANAGRLGRTKEVINSSEYVIGPENALQIDVYYGKNEKISQKVRVSSRGIINFPLVGEVDTTGLTVTELQDKLASLLEKDYLVNPQVTVFIEEYSTVSIMGEVTKPGAYPIKGQLTVVELISLAQGFTKIASPNKVKVIRHNADGTQEEIIVRVYDLMNKEGGDKDNVVLHSGDVVIVPESLF